MIISTLEFLFISIFSNMFFISLLFACLYHVQIQTTPRQAEVLFRDTIYTSKGNPRRKSPVSEDIYFHFRKMPFQKTCLEIRADGYRTIATTIKLQRHRLLFHRINYYHFMLISDHSGAGSWSPEEVLEKP